MPLETLRAQIITIGTEITCGEVVNTNAAWVSLQLESAGVRVFSHLTVRDQAREIRRALDVSADYDLVIVTGGLGPTSDDITRASLAEFSERPLEFDEEVWQQLRLFYQERALPLREAHRHQCYFPTGSERLLNPVGTALGFALEFHGRPYFVLPGPPRELEGMWKNEVSHRLQSFLARRQTAQAKRHQWVRWTCLGAPESEVAELVEAAIEGTGLEVGYRAAIPYVKVKVFANPEDPNHARAMAQVDRALKPYLIGEGDVDLATELLQRWTGATLRVRDTVSGIKMGARLFAAREQLEDRGLKGPQLELFVAPEGGSSVPHIDFDVRREGETLRVELRHAEIRAIETKTLPYKIKLDSERGRRSAAEWALWLAVRALRA